MPIDRLALMDSLTWIVLDRAVQKHLFGEKYVTLLNYVVCTGLQYENFAILGRAFINRLPLLERLFGGGGSFEFTQGVAKDLLNEFKEYAGKKEERSAVMLGHITKTYPPDRVKRWQKLYKDAARLEYPDMKPASFFLLARYVLNERHEYEIPLFPKEVDMQELNEEITLQMAKTFLMPPSFDGIGFGIFYPDSTEKMYHNPEIPEWNEIRKNHCPIILEELVNTSYKEREDLVLERVTLFAKEHCPELLGELEFG